MRRTPPEASPMKSPTSTGSSFGVDQSGSTWVTSGIRAKLQAGGGRSRSRSLRGNGEGEHTQDRKGQQAPAR